MYCVISGVFLFFFFFFKRKTAYEMRISDWSSDVCSSDLLDLAAFDLRARGRHGVDGQRNLFADHVGHGGGRALVRHAEQGRASQIGRASCRERVWQYV